MKLKKKTKVILFLISIVAITIISAILAYLTDKATRDNQFTIGSIEIDLVEESWENLAPEDDLNENGIPDVAEALGPNQTVAKDPKVQNIGDNDAYVYLRVVVPKGEVGVAGGELEMQELFSYEINEDHWVLMDGLTIDGEDYVTYTYYYKKEDGNYILKSGDETETLFDEVTLANITDFNGLDLTQQIIVKAYAIQTDENIDVENNKWIAEFTNEKNGIPTGMVMARVANEPEDPEEGFQPGEDVIVETEVNGELFGGENQEPIDETNAPILTGQFGDGEHREGVLDTTPVANKQKGELVAISSRASGGKKVTKLRYKFEVKDGDIGQFKIISFTGNLYNKTGREVAVETPILKKEEMAKAVVKEPVAKLLYKELTSKDYGKVVIKDFPDYELFYVGPVRNSETTTNESTTDKIVLIYDGDKGFYPNSEIPNGTNLSKDGLYNVYFSNLSLNDRNIQALNRLRGSSWTNKIVPNKLQEKEITASGGVGVSIWINSWNQLNPTEKIYKRYYTNNSSEGWLVSRTVSSDSAVPNSSYNISSNKVTNTNTLYFPCNDSPRSYWLLSISAFTDSYLMMVDCSGWLGEKNVGNKRCHSTCSIYSSKY